MARINRLVLLAVACLHTPHHAYRRSLTKQIEALSSSSNLREVNESVNRASSPPPTIKDLPNYRGNEKRYAATLQRMYMSPIWNRCLSCDKVDLSLEGKLYKDCLKKPKEKRDSDSCVPEKVKRGKACCTGKENCLKGATLDDAVARCAGIPSLSFTPVHVHNQGCVLSDEFRFRDQEVWGGKNCIPVAAAPERRTEKKRQLENSGGRPEPAKIGGDTESDRGSEGGTERDLTQGELTGRDNTIVAESESGIGGENETKRKKKKNSSNKESGVGTDLPQGTKMASTSGAESELAKIGESGQGNEAKKRKRKTKKKKKKKKNKKKKRGDADHPPNTTKPITSDAESDQPKQKNDEQRDQAEEGLRTEEANRPSTDNQFGPLGLARLVQGSTVKLETSRQNPISAQSSDSHTKCCCVWIDPTKFVSSKEVVALHFSIDDGLTVGRSGYRTKSCPAVATTAEEIGNTLSTRGKKKRYVLRWEDDVCGCAGIFRYQTPMKCRKSETLSETGVEYRSFQSHSETYFGWRKATKEQCSYECTNSKPVLVKDGCEIDASTTG